MPPKRCLFRWLQSSARLLLPPLWDLLKAPDDPAHQTWNVRMPKIMLICIDFYYYSIFSNVVHKNAHMYYFLLLQYFFNNLEQLKSSSACLGRLAQPDNVQTQFHNKQAGYERRGG